jgi:hypothetical protein
LGERRALVGVCQILVA